MVQPSASVGATLTSSGRSTDLFKALAKNFTKNGVERKTAEKAVRL
jgi:hypothetical protein